MRFAVLLLPLLLPEMVVSRSSHDSWRSNLHGGMPFFSARPLSTTTTAPAIRPSRESSSLLLRGGGEWDPHHGGQVRGGSVRPPMPEPRAAATKEKRTSGDLSTTTVATRPTSVVPIKATEVVVTSDGEAVPEKLTRKQKKNYKKYAKKLKNRNHTNLRRKVMHACFGLGFAFLRHILPNSKFLPGMILLSGSTMIMELLRYREGFHWMNDALHFCLGNTLRKNEMDGKFTGSFYFFAGVTLTAALCDKTSACLGIAQLALADPSASYFGRATRHVYWSRIENGCFGIGRNKGILGFLGGALFCFPFNYRVLSLARCGPAATALPGGRTSVAVASLALGLAGALADLAVPTPAVTLPKRVWGVRVPPLHVDDNFVVPVTSGLACRQLFSKLGWNSQLVQLSRWMIA